MSTETVLVIDDELNIRELIAETLEADGYKVMQAETGARAVAVLASRPVDIVLCDIQLPDTSGIEQASRSPAQPENKPIVMDTAPGDAAKGIQALNVAASDHTYQP